MSAGRQTDRRRGTDASDKLVKRQEAPKERSRWQDECIKRRDLASRKRYFDTIRIRAELNAFNAEGQSGKLEGANMKNGA